jgi:hypothetical protein
MRKVALGAALTVAALLVGCHTITEELPTEPTEAEKPASTGILTVPIPALSVATTATPAPSPDPSAPPAPGPTPEPSPTPPPEPEDEPPPEDTFGCGEPLPPPIGRVNVKIHFARSAKWTLDSTPLTGDWKYCKKIGFTDGRNNCPVRPEGHPERKACEEYAVGYAEDTGRTGPTWFRDKKHCDGTACENSPTNQYQVFAYLSGTYKACVKSGACGRKEIRK